MTLRLRLALGILAISLILLAPLIITHRALVSLDMLMNKLRTGEFAATLAVGRLRGTVDEARREELAVNVLREAAPVERLDSVLKAMLAVGDTLRAFDLDSAGQIAAGVRAAQLAVPIEFANLRAGRDSAADSVASNMFRPAMDQVLGAAAVAEAALQQRTSQRVDEATVASDEARSSSLYAFTIAAVLATIVAALLTQAISRPVSDLQRGLGAVADGDFSYRLSFRGDRPDEFGRLAESFQTMSSQLAQLDKLKAEFVSVASHELKTPINVIMGYLQLLEEGVYGDLTPKQREVCRTLEQQGDALARLVRQLLDVSRFEAGGGKLEPRGTSLSAFLEDLQLAFNVLAVQRNITFEIVRDSALPDEVFWDPDRVNEVLGNILSNAFKFTPRGGRVELRVRAMAESVHMDVCDTGAGIAASQLPYVFKKFYQADNQSAASAKGTGLGLAIAKEIVEAHRGTITVRSARGEGTTFSITLPVHVPTARRTTSSQRTVAVAG